MPITAAQLVAEVKVSGDAEAKQKLEGVSREVQQTSEKAKEAGGMFKSALAFAGGQAIFAGLGFLKEQITSIFTETEAHQDAMAQLNQVLKSTGDVSGETASSLSGLADAFGKTTRFSADTVMGGENLLLTFTNIGKGVFPQATQAILDVSQAMGQDLKSSAIQVGKALGDPLTGMTALQRIGVTFSTQEKEQIKTMMAHNDIMGAQKVILHELSTEFGGSATAAGKTFAGQMDILKNRFEEFKISVGERVMPILSNFLGFVTGTVAPALGAAFQNIVTFLKPFWYLLQDIGATAMSAFKDIGDTLTQVGQIFKSVFGSFGGGDNPLVMFFSDLIGKAYPIIQTIGQAFHGFMMMLQKDLSTINPQAIISALQPLISIVGGTLAANFKFFGDTIKQIAGWVQSSLIPAFQQAWPGFEKLASAIIGTVVPAILKLWSIGEGIARSVIPVLISAFETIAPIVVKVAGFIAGLLGQAIQFVIPYILQAAAQVGAFASQIASRAIPVVQEIGSVIGTILGWIMQHWGQIWGVIGPIVHGAFDVVVGVIKTAWSIISGIFKVALDLLSGNWGKAWDDMKAMLGGVFDGIGSMVHGFVETIGGAFSGLGTLVHDIWDGIVGAIKSAINAVIDIINGIIGGIDAIHVDVGPVHVGFNIPKIPHLDTGGAILSTGLAMVHRGEYIVPAAGVAPAGTGGQIVVQPPDIYLDGYLLTRGLMPYVANAVRAGTGKTGI